DGSYLCVNDRGTFVLDETRAVTRMIGFVVDVTDRRRADQRLAAQHAVTRVLVAAATPEAAAPGVIEAIAQAVGGVFGAAWEVDRAEGCLRCASVWQRGEGFAALADETRTSRVTGGEGTLATAWATARPVVRRDASR